MRLSEELNELAINLNWRENHIENDFNLSIDIEKLKFRNREIYTLFNWLQFFQSSENLEFTSFGYFLPFETALNLFLKEKQLKFKKLNLFPIIKNEFGDIILINTSMEKACLEIYSPSLFLIKPISFIENICLFISLINECYKLNIYKIKNQLLTYNLDLEEEVFLKLSPVYKNWVLSR